MPTLYKNHRLHGSPSIEVKLPSTVAVVVLGGRGSWHEVPRSVDAQLDPATQTFVSWNHIANWLRRLEALRQESSAGANLFSVHAIPNASPLLRTSLRKLHKSGPFNGFLGAQSWHGRRTNSVD
jgi:hypothetical protein